MSIKAFVSSTFIDLENHRAHVIDTLRKSDFFVNPMEDWVASKDEPKIFSQERIEGCDLCILIVAFRRGFIPQGEKLSITQLEYLSAKSKGIDVLVFMLDENAPWPRSYDDLDKDPEVKNWREMLKREHGVGFFGLSPESLDISPALTRWLSERNFYHENRYDYKHILSLQPALEEIELLCNLKDNSKALEKLRDMIVLKLTKLASRNKLKSHNIAPADLLKKLYKRKLVDYETIRSLEYALGVTSEILYSKKVKIEEAKNAIQETAVGFHLIDKLIPDLPQFRITTAKNGQSFFVFLLNGKKVLVSDFFQSSQGVLNGVRSARRNVEQKRIFNMVAKNGKSYFKIIAANGQIIASSILLKDKIEIDRLIYSIIEHLPSAPIIDLAKDCKSRTY